MHDAAVIGQFDRDAQRLHVWADARLLAAARLLRANFAVTKDDAAVLNRDERHAVAVAQVVIEYHCRQGPVVLWPSI